MKISQFVFLLIVTLITFSCSSPAGKKGEQDRQVVTVSILPQKTFVEKIAGDDFDIQVLVPEGSSPETYTMLPSQLRELSRSLVWFRLGHLGFEVSWNEKIKELNREMLVINHDDGMDLIRGEEIQHGDHTHPGGVDPHIWLSPVLVKQMVNGITRTLTELNPENRDKYSQNQETFLKEINQLDSTIRAELKEYKGKEFVTFHPSLSYFAREYGLVQHALESDGKEPTAQHMAQLVDRARKENIKAIYIQNEFDVEHARVFAEEINAKIVEVRPLSPDWEENLRELTRQFIENF